MPDDAPAAVEVRIYTIRVYFRPAILNCMLDPAAWPGVNVRQDPAFETASLVSTLDAGVYERLKARFERPAPAA